MIEICVLLALCAASTISGLPVDFAKYNTVVHPNKDIVISPKILDPTAETVWTAGQEVTVLWETWLYDKYPEASDHGLLTLGTLAFLRFKSSYPEIDLFLPRRFRRGTLPYRFVATHPLGVG